MKGSVAKERCYKKGQKKAEIFFGYARKKYWKKCEKSEKMVFLRGHKKLETQSGSSVNSNHDILEVLRQESRARRGERMQAGWVGDYAENFPSCSHQYRRI